MDELSRRGKQRVKALQQLYVNDEIDIITFEEMLTHALNNEPPFLKRLFKMRDDVRRKRYTEETVWLWQGEEFVEDGDYIIPADEKEFDRTIDVTPSYAADL